MSDDLGKERGHLTVNRETLVLGHDGRWDAMCFGNSLSCVLILQLCCLMFSSNVNYLRSKKLVS